jgi:hypothetical protein
VAAVVEPFPVKFDANFPQSPAPTQTPVANKQNKVLDNLFQSTYPDPFRETSPEVVPQTQLENTSSSNLDNVADDSPTTANQLLVAPKSGHRRNMSDTSAFNK